MKNHYDYIVVGSGFGGSVSAMRLSEKGYNVLVIEKGRRWESSDFPRTNWNLRKYLWAPVLRCFGFLRLSFFREVFILSGVGVGGGSLVYANTLMMPKESFYQNPVWSHLKNWKETLAPHYQRALVMLGASRYEKENAEDIVLKSVAEELGRGDTYKRVDYVAVYQGDPQVESDPYFNGKGPLRRGCTECAGCMVGCRFNAKNTLDKNYLWLAEKEYGACIVPETEVVSIESLPEGGYSVKTRSSTSWFRKRVTTYTCDGIVVSGGVLGTLDLLLRQKHVDKTLPALSDRLGENLLTNSEMLSGVIGADRKLNHGIAISSIFDVDENTHIELCKFPDKSGALFKLALPAAGNGTPLLRIGKMLAHVFSSPVRNFRAAFQKNPARNAIIFLIMQSLPNAMRMTLRRGIFGHTLAFRNDSGTKVPSFIPAGQDALHRYARKVNGVPQNAATEILFGMASTAHILGGCPMGASAAEGVVNDRFEVHGYRNFFILDGSVVPCNLGVNPSLTITALSEYAMSMVPEADRTGKNG